MSRLPRSSVTAVAATLAATIVVVTPAIALGKHSPGGPPGGGSSSTSTGTSTSTPTNTPTGTPAVDPVYSGRA